MRKKMALLALATLVMSSACSRGQGREHKSDPVPEVATVTIQPQEVELTTTLPGRTSAYYVAEIRPQVSGIIQKRLFQEGSDIKAGQLLYQIDAAPFKAALDSAKASLARARAELPSARLRAERYKEALADRAVSQQDYDDAAAALDQVLAEIEYWQAEIDKARINLGYTRVNAPVSGRIGKSNVTEGATVTAYQAMPLATIQRLDPIYVDITQSAAELLRLRRRLESGQVSIEKDSRKVRLILETGTPYPHEGTLQFRDVTVNPSTGSYILRAVVPNPDHVLLPGMFVRAVVQEGIVKNALLAPQQGVTRDRKGEPFALVVDDSDTVRRRRLAIDRAIGNKWLVISGLEAGDRLIVEGRLKVRPGDTVKAVSLEGQKVASGAPAGSRSQGYGGL